MSILFQHTCINMYEILMFIGICYYSYGKENHYRVGLTFTEISQILSQLHGLTVSA